MNKCSYCNNQLSGKRTVFCSANCSNESYKLFRKNNQKKINNDAKEYLKRTNYASEKTPEQRKLRNIKRETRRLYPLLKCLKCEFCENGATEHHHYTKPIEIDKFKFVCHPCHGVLNTMERGIGK